MTGQPRLLDGHASLFVQGAGAPGPGIRRPGPRQHVCGETLDGPDRPDVTRRHAVGTSCRRLEAGVRRGWRRRRRRPGCESLPTCRVNVRCDERVWRLPPGPDQADPQMLVHCRLEAEYCSAAAW